MQKFCLLLDVGATNCLSASSLKIRVYYYSLLNKSLLLLGLLYILRETHIAYILFNIILNLRYLLSVATIIATTITIMIITYYRKQRSSFHQQETNVRLDKHTSTHSSLHTCIYM